MFWTKGAFAIAFLYTYDSRISPPIAVEAAFTFRIAIEVGTFCPRT